MSGEGVEVFRPLFTFHGFQFAQISIEGKIEFIDVVAEAMYSDLSVSGHFECSDKIVNKIYNNALWSQRDNFLNVPTDCPQRDERLGWTADAQIFCQSAMYNMDCRIFYEKYLSDIRDAQLGNGVIPTCAPLPHIGFYSYTGRATSAGWLEAIAEITYYHYKMYGDKKVVRDNLPAIKKMLDYCAKDSDGYIRNGEDMYGDWLNVNEDTDTSLLSTMYYARASLIAHKLCSVLDDFEKDYYKELYINIKNAFRKRFLYGGKLESDTQSAYIIAYKFGLLDCNEVKSNIIRKLESNNNHLSTGFLGVKFLLPALCDLGLSDIAYTLITYTDYPSWGYSVVNGATTIWEHWNSYTKENGILDGMNSFNHYSFGSCTEWMYEYCLGIMPDEKFGLNRKIKFNPYIDLSGKITSAKGYYITNEGKIDVMWEKKSDEFVYQVTVPNGIDAEFYFPKLKVIDKINSNGKYIFRLSL